MALQSGVVGLQVALQSGVVGLQVALQSGVVGLQASSQRRRVALHSGVVGLQASSQRRRVALQSGVVGLQNGWRRSFRTVRFSTCTSWIRAFLRWLQNQIFRREQNETIAQSTSQSTQRSHRNQTALLHPRRRKRRKPPPSPFTASASGRGGMRPRSSDRSGFCVRAALACSDSKTTVKKTRSVPRRLAKHCATRAVSKKTTCGHRKRRPREDRRLVSTDTLRSCVSLVRTRRPFRLIRCVHPFSH